MTDINAKHQRFWLSVSVIKTSCMYFFKYLQCTDLQFYCMYRRLQKFLLCVRLLTSVIFFFFFKSDCISRTKHINVTIRNHLGPRLRILEIDSSIHCNHSISLRQKVNQYQLNNLYMLQFSLRFFVWKTGRWVSTFLMMNHWAIV